MEKYVKHKINLNIKMHCFLKNYFLFNCYYNLSSKYFISTKTTF